MNESDNNNQVNSANPNQNSNSNSDSKYHAKNNKKNEPDKHADTKKVVDTVAKGASNYFAPGVGGTIYEAAKKVPVVNNVVDKGLDTVSKVADTVPGVKPLTKALNKSGVTDAANTAMDFINPTKAAANPSTIKNVANGANNVGKTANKFKNSSANKAKDASKANPKLRKNQMFSNLAEMSNSLPSSEEVPNEALDEGTEPTAAEQTNNNNEKEQPVSGTNEEPEEGGKNKVSLLFLIVAIPFILLFILIISLAGGVDGFDPIASYYDPVCDYNSTQVQITNCYNNTSEKQIYDTVSLKDYIIGAIHAYTYNDTYTDEQLKALMIILKTNALSYGNYNSNNKSITLKSCSLNLNYCDPKNGCDIKKEEYYPDIDTYIPSTTPSIESLSTTRQSELEVLYEEVSPYLYLKSTTTETITTLDSYNVLPLDNDILTSLKASDSSYSDILNNLYQDYDTDTLSTTNTLYFGNRHISALVDNEIINSSNTIIASGYNDLLIDSSNINSLLSLIKPSLSYNIVIWLDPNDYLENDAKKYFLEYERLATSTFLNQHLYIISLPISIESPSITSFNDTLENLINTSGISNLKFIKLDYTPSTYNSDLTFGKEDYQKISNLINANLTKIFTSSLALYDLNSYCTAYIPTDNEAYWWPVGSNEATDGNIYGGDPSYLEITSMFGPRTDPITGKPKAGHGAIDIAVPTNTPIIATKNGTVKEINEGCRVGNMSCGGCYGNFVKIEHDGGVQTLYAHLTTVVVKEGDLVRQGQIIGYSGNTGRSTGPHLHFGVYIDGTSVDPLNYVDPNNPRPVADHGQIISSNNEGGKEAVCQALLTSGLSKNAVIGILINIAHEGAFKTNNLEDCYEEDVCCKLSNDGGKTYYNYGYCIHPDIGSIAHDDTYTTAIDNNVYSKEQFMNDHAGYGLIGWTASSRKGGLYDYAKKYNKSIANVGVQLSYLLEEIEDYPVTYKYITGSYSAYDIANNFCLDFEKPYNREENCKNRVQTSLEAYTNFVNNNCKD